MTDKTTPAFPLSALVYNYDDGAPDTIIHEGISMRDYFAARAMQAYLTSTGGASAPDEMVAHAAYKTADEMMKARQP